MERKKQIRFSLLKSLGGKFRHFGIPVACILLVTLQFAWQKTHPKYIGLPLGPEDLYLDNLDSSDQVEEKFHRMTRILKSLVEEVKKQKRIISELKDRKRESLNTSYGTWKQPKKYYNLKKAKVIVQKAHVRKAPDIKSPSLLFLAKGNDLIVDKELANWSRVLTPTGIRGWISKTVIEIENEALL